jgi:hypothetical protein
VLVLLDRSGALIIEWGQVWAYWPVLLILIGVSVIGGTGIVGRAASVLTGIMSAALVVAFLNFGASPREDKHEKRTAFAEPVRAGTTAASFSLDGGAGTFLIAGGGDGLMEATVDADPWTYAVDRDSGGERDQVRMWMDQHDGVSWAWRVRNTVDIGLNRGPSWEIDVEAGAARVDADLRSLVVERLRMSAGASTIKVQLGSRARECTMILETGVSSVRIEVPESVGCNVNIDAPVSSKRLQGFEHRGGGWYETENFATAEKKVHLEISAGVSSIRVIRVPGDGGIDL